MSQNLIYLKTEDGTETRLFSQSADELESLIDDLNLNIVNIKTEELPPFLKAIALLTEIKLFAKTN